MRWADAIAASALFLFAPTRSPTQGVPDGSRGSQACWTCSKARHQPKQAGNVLVFNHE